MKHPQWALKYENIKLKNGSMWCKRPWDKPFLEDFPKFAAPIIKRMKGRMKYVTRIPGKSWLNGKTKEVVVLVEFPLKDGRPTQQVIKKKVKEAQDKLVKTLEMRADAGYDRMSMFCCLQADEPGTDGREPAFQYLIYCEVGK